ncbi:MAG: hypothetical protein H2174_03600 [Vampirovibrio sp.]|nr:hypothetical protein [Vampirovibrio sp.]
MKPLTKPLKWLNNFGNSYKKAEPTYALIDSQSVKTTLNAEERGIDGEKKGEGS